MGRGGEGERGRQGRQGGQGTTGVGDKGDKGDKVIISNQLPTIAGEPVAWVGKTPLRPLARPQDRSGSPTKGAPSPTAPNPGGVHHRRHEGKRHCDPWPDPKTAVAPLPRARSSPGGIFPTADFAPLHHQLPAAKYC
ncbi:MAG: hypothetical protein ACHBN1_25930 [Heteroscytonema crispum UTEX LB 1556]